MGIILSTSYMLTPNRLEEWTFARIKQLLKAGACESDSFDFKESLPDARNDGDKVHLRKTIVAFANSGGGFLVYGVNDGRAIPIESRLPGLPADLDFPKAFGEYPKHCVPSVGWQACEAPIKIPRTKKVLHVVEIFSDPRKPYATIIDRVPVFVRRSNGGNVIMSFPEISAAFRESEFRRNGLALLISELDHMRATADQLVSDSSFGNTEAHPDLPWTWTVRYSTTLLDTALGNTYPFLSADPQLWQILCSIREKARASNARSEAIAGVIFLRQTERVTITDSMTRRLIECARIISKEGKEAAERLRKL